jgi:hypothetical protein
MKKPFRYKKFLIIFGGFIAFLLLLYALWICLKAAFPLPPEREMTIAENKIHIDTIEYIDDNLYGFLPEFAPYDEESLVIAVPFDYDEDSELKPFTRIYRVLKSGEILGTFDVDFAVTRIYAFEDGNIGLVNYIQNDERIRLFLYEYSPEFELIREAEFPSSILGSPLRLEYSNGLFYQGGLGVTVFDRDFNIKETFEVENEEKDGLTFVTDYNGNPYLFLRKTGPEQSIYPLTYYIRPLSGDEFVPIEVDDKSYYSLTGGPYPGDSEYPFFGALTHERGVWSEFFNTNLRGEYILGQSMDGNTVKVTAPINYRFLRSEILGDKRYFAYAESENIGNMLYEAKLYLYEYEHYYED